MSTAPQDVHSRVIVIGPGATGGALASELHLNGVDVVVVARGAELGAIRENGLVYHTVDGSRNVPLNVVGGPSEIDLREDDVIVVTTKSQDIEPLLREWAWEPVALQDGGTAFASQVLPLVTVQNGLNTERVALRWFKHVIGGTIMCPGGKDEVGEIINFGPELRLLLWIGHYPARPQDAALDRVVATLLQAPTLGMQGTDDIDPIKAYKAAYNTRNGLEPVFEHTPLRDDLETRAREEAIEVLRAIDLEPQDPWADSRWEHTALEGGVVAGHARLGNSTLQSFRRGAPLETDYLNGEFVLLGRLHGVPTPINEALQVLTATAVAEGRPAGALGDDDIRELLERIAGVHV